MLVTSSQNAKLKQLRALYKDKKLRNTLGVFIAEGVNLVKDIPETFTVKEIFIKESKMPSLCCMAEKFGLEIITVKNELFDSVSDTVTPSGIIAVVEKPKNKLEAEGEIVLLLDGISDSGNLGTIIRTASAKGIKTVVCAECADAFSPKCVRSAMSGTFFTNIIECDQDLAFNILSDYDIIALDMGGKSIYSYKKEGKIAIAVGNEAHGLSNLTRINAKVILSIPMNGKVESLNAGVSASIAMYLIN